MTTKREHLTLLNALVKKFPDLVLRPVKFAMQKVIPSPIHHIEFRIFIDRTSSRNLFNLKLVIWTMYDATMRAQSCIEYMLHHTVTRPGAGNLWDMTDPYVIPDMIEVVERKVLAKLRRMRNSVDLEEFLQTDRFVGEFHYCFPNVRALLALGKGNFQKAAETFEKDSWAPILADLDEHGEGLGTRIREQGDKIGREDRKLLASLFHKWEAANIERRGMQAHWQPTPFPFEDM